jgi:Protein of unknown function (DUF3060)
MNPDDDPEARIRELERPLGDVAKATELGTGQSGASYPPPAGQIPPQGLPGGGGYQPPFPTYPAPQPSSGSRLWLIVAAVAVVLIAAVAAVVVYTTNVFTSSFPFTSTPASPTRAAGGGGFDTIPSIPGGIGVEPAPSVQSPASGGQLSVSGIGETKTLACNDTEVSISGVSNTITITGHCASIQVSGVSNVITVDSADAINASGIQNRVTFHSGQPAVDNSGSQNVVEQG